MVGWNFMYGVLLTLFAHAQCIDVVVDTSNGQVEGVQVDQYGIFKFFGIPYAEPPVRDRRFQRPTLKFRTAGKFKASEPGPSCPQPLLPATTTSEDCLTLNIFVPRNASRTDPLNVMVWIHGGAYIIGNGSFFDATVLAGLNDVIVVTINYRLGILGFFNTLDDNAVGNFGLWDQTMALQWVKLNIASFGGDSNSVTIFGESAGSSSVMQLAISPMTQGLFHRVIAESGSMFAPWSYNINPIKTAKALGRRLGCPTNDNKALVRCMKGVTVETLVENTDISIDLAYGENTWVPAYMGVFFPYTPDQLFTTHKSSDVTKRLAEIQLMIGLNMEEGAIFYNVIVFPYRMKGEVNDSVDGLSASVFHELVTLFCIGVTSGNTRHAHGIQPSIEYMYKDWKVDSGMSRSKMFIKLIADSWFNAWSVKTARAHSGLRETGDSNRRRTYFYRFHHRNSWTPTEPWRSGADHTDELPFVFGLPFTGLVNSTSAEQELSKAVMAYWTNFAKTGNPNLPIVSAIKTEWPEFTSETEQFIELDVGMSQSSTGHHIWGNRVAFWLNYFPELLALTKSLPDPSVCV